MLLLQDFVADSSETIQQSVALAPCAAAAAAPHPAAPSSIINHYNTPNGATLLAEVVVAPKQAVSRSVTVTLPDEDPLLCPAQDLRVTRKVGQDGLVIAWQPSLDPECAGYMVIYLASAI